MEDNDREIYHFEVADIHIKQKPMYAPDGKLNNGFQFKPIHEFGFMQRIIRNNARCFD